MTTELEYLREKVTYYEEQVSVGGCISYLNYLLSMHNLNYYQLVELMTPEMREGLGNALYAYNANQDALTDNVQ